MRLLLLSQFYWPEQRSAPMTLSAVAEHLVAGGHEVTVVTGFPNHPFGRIYDGYRLRWRQWEQLRGVRVLRLPLYADHSLSPLRRGWHYASFALSAGLLGPLLTRGFRPDLLFVYLPPLTNWLPIRTLRAWHRVPAVYWVTDVWPEALEATGVGLPRWASRALGRLDRMVLGAAVRICVNSPGLAGRMESVGVDPAKLEVVPDAAKQSHFRPVEPDPALAEELGLRGTFNFVYGGNFGPAQGLGTLLDAAARVRDLSDVRLVLIGGGEEEERLKQRVVEERLDNVVVVPRQPMEEIHRFYALADALVVHLLADPLFDLQVPSKTMAYMACGKPILCAAGASAAQIVITAGAGWTSAAGDAEALARSFRETRALDREVLRDCGRNARRAYLRDYTETAQVRRFEEILLRECRERGAGPSDHA
ncbi:MAG: glycosyltransferase WbuB [Acidobacteria bacterium]|nr:MAG: glycosyltransferase WbuB [Acidobacteriota bacterium]REK04400.1 MAG: glycosyltransferase WbuB [Acidobacteriota bacterium]